MKAQQFRFDSQCPRSGREPVLKIEIDPDELLEE
jgi:hypothetical protein